MGRIQIHIEEDLDDAAAAEAARGGMSKAALIREAVTKAVPRRPEPDDPWEAIIGWLDDDPADDIDEVIYGPSDA